MELNVVEKAVRPDFEMHAVLTAIMPPGLQLAGQLGIRLTLRHFNLSFTCIVVLYRC